MYFVLNIGDFCYNFQSEFFNNGSAFFVKWGAILLIIECKDFNVPLIFLLYQILLIVEFHLNYIML